MANEVRVQSSLYVRQTDADNNVILEYQSRPTSFIADMTGAVGPSPGAVLVPTTGVDVDLSALTQPGFCHLMNLDDANFVEWGIKEPVTGFFYPIGILRPGRSFVMEFSPNLLEEYTGTGTGTSAATNTLHLKANTAQCAVLVAAFEA